MKCPICFKQLTIINNNLDCSASHWLSNVEGDGTIHQYFYAIELNNELISATALYCPKILSIAFSKFNYERIKIPHIIINIIDDIPDTSTLHRMMLKLNDNQHFS